MWRSLVARVVRDDEVAGSNPVIPTTSPGPLDRGFVVSAVFLPQVSQQILAQVLLQIFERIKATPLPAQLRKQGGRFHIMF